MNFYYGWMNFFQFWVKNFKVKIYNVSCLWFLCSQFLHPHVFWSCFDWQISFPQNLLQCQPSPLDIPASNTSCLQCHSMSSHLLETLASIWTHHWTPKLLQQAQYQQCEEPCNLCTPWSRKVIDAQQSLEPTLPEIAGIFAEIISKVRTMLVICYLRWAQVEVHEINTRMVDIADFDTSFRDSWH